MTTFDSFSCIYSVVLYTYFCTIICSKKRHRINERQFTDTASLKTVEQRSVSTNTNEIIMQTFEVNF